MAAFNKQQKKDPQDDIRKLAGIISSGTFKNIHLLCGEEDYLRNQFRDKLVDGLTGGEKSMNFDRFTGKDTVPEQIIDLAETMPFFSERRVILIEDSGWLKSSCDKIADYIKQGICSSTFMVFCEREVDKRNRLYKAIEEAGMVSEFITQTDTTLAAWINKQIKSAGMQIAGNDLQYLINMLGTDMESISNEVEKLISYCLGRDRVTRSDIDAICSRKLENKIFEMCDAIALKRQKEALRMYYDLMGLRESSIKILVLITRQYNTLLQVKDMELDHKSDKDIADMIKRPAWTIKDYRAQTSHYTVEELKDIVEKCAELDYRIKSGKVNEDIGLEMLIVELSVVYN